MSSLSRDEVMDLYEDVSDYWKERLVKKYPEYFKLGFIEGEVYTFGNTIFQYYKDTKGSYTLDDFEYCESSGYISYLEDKFFNCKVVTDENILNRFFRREAERRGYFISTKYKDYQKQQPVTVGGEFFYYIKDKLLTDGYGGAVYRGNKWSQIIK